MPHKHKRLKISSASTSSNNIHDLPPTSLARSLPVSAPHKNSSTHNKTHKPTSHNHRKKPHDNDTPRAFTSLMAYATTGLKTPRGLDDAPQPSKTQSFKTQSSKKREHSPERNVPTIKPGEHLSDFAARVDREISVGRARKGTGGKGVLGGEGARKTRLEKRMQRMQRLWREEDGRLRERREEARDEDDDELDIAGGKKKMKKGKRKRKGGNVGGRGDGEDGEGDEDDDEEEDPWAVVARNRKREMEEREKTSGGGGLVGLHDVVKAPPKFSTVPKRKLNLKVDGGDMDVVGEMVKKGGLKRQVELSEARRGVIEGYRAMMREKAQAHHPS